MLGSNEQETKGEGETEKQVQLLLTAQFVRYRRYQKYKISSVKPLVQLFFQLLPVYQKIFFVLPYDLFRRSILKKICVLRNVPGCRTDVRIAPVVYAIFSSYLAFQYLQKNIRNRFLCGDLGEVPSFTRKLMTKFKQTYCDCVKG